jgi:hypothetical protein
MEHHMLVLDLVWAEHRKMSGEGYIGDRTVLDISTGTECGGRAYDQRIDLQLVRLARMSWILIRHGKCFRI